MLLRFCTTCWKWVPDRDTFGFHKFHFVCDTPTITEKVYERLKEGV